ncbi:beta-ketoacyl-ACP synthase [Arenicella xantha]|uniref:3-oxoacyl-[acyl-carrier-protein] synthase-1 n=1 Tax=Arenicella xantha TaxID=644221 RepID=A0A395JVY5_9GAMM|nr:beta-ketoacyl-ACP synthase [Arenicella xantha]RBP53728.1 3-oxoacyl-[acyl-carrier-protein] synthase-1 [Arenicella xantha]
MDIRLLDYQSTSAAGVNVAELRQSIDAQRSGLRKNDLPNSDLNTWVGRVAGIEACEQTLGEWQSRNNALAALGYQQGDLRVNIDKLKQQYQPSRLGIVMGSSTSSIDRTESAYRELQDDELSPPFRQARVHNPHAPSLYVAHMTGITGPAMTINTACSSSAKVFATGARWLELGVVDAVLVGGVDTLCLSVLHGFDSLQLISENQCMPLDQHRDGINLGEASGYAILVRADEGHADTGIRLVGYGESSDAHHMSHPHPDGLGAELAMQQALAMADLQAEQIDYINLHGTSSRANDLIEGQLIAKLFPTTTQVSSTKAWMGHTLGAAGITEALIAVDALQRGVIPGSLNLTELDQQLSLSVQADNIVRELSYVLSNSFGFGGNNCCLVFGRVA